MKRVLLSVAVGASLLALVSVAVARPVPIGRFVRIPYGVSHAHPWPTDGGNSDRAHRSSHLFPKREPRRLWDRKVGRGRLAGPILAGDGAIYVGDSMGLIGLARDGTARFRKSLGVIAAAPSIDPSDDLVAPTHHGLLTRVSFEGHLRSYVRVGASLSSSPLVLDDGSAVVLAADNALHRFDAEGGRIFRSVFRSEPLGPPALTADQTLVVPITGGLARLDLDGRQKSLIAFASAPVTGPAAFKDGTTWIVLEEGRLVAIETDDRLRVQVELPGRGSRQVALAIDGDGGVRVAGPWGLVAVGNGGVERWRFDSEGGFTSGLVVDAAGVVVGATEHNDLVAVDADGQLLWKVPLGAPASSPAVVDSEGVLYITTRSGTMQAWR